MQATRATVLVLFKEGYCGSENNGRFYTRGRIIRPDELSFEIRLERRTTKGSSGPIMRLVPVLMLETHNPDELQSICPSSSRRIMRP